MLHAHVSITQTNGPRKGKSLLIELDHQIFQTVVDNRSTYLWAVEEVKDECQHLVIGNVSRAESILLSMDDNGIGSVRDGLT